jgi:type IX secretion system PorP/SprF family membrane protein
MKQLTFSVLMVLSGMGLFAQQDAQYSQFIFNKLSFNPAYVGSKEALALASVYRYQWQGIEGAPRTLNVQTHAPFANYRNGIGLSITSDQVGILNSSLADLFYAYRIPFRNKSTLSIGLQTRFEYTRLDLTDVELIHIGDNSVPTGEGDRTNINFGLGVYYSAKSFFVGLSAPQLLKNTLYNDDFIGLGRLSRFRSYYLMAGVIAPVGNNVYFKPSMMISYNPNAPFEMNFNASFLFMEALWLGVSYRLGDSVQGVVQYQFNKQFKAGLALDFTLSELQRYTAGSLEVMVEYLFSFEKDGINNIRFF